MKKSIIILSLILLASVYVNAQDAKGLMKKSSDAVSADAMEMTSTLKIYDNKGNVRVRQVSNITKKFGNVRKTMMKFLSPADVRGTAMLIFDYEDKDDDMWVYLPSMKKTRRIVSSQKASSFMGSEFSNSDMSSPNMDDFTYKLLGTETVDGKVCHKIESTCKTTEIASVEKFVKKITYIDKNNFLPYKTDFYDKDNKLIKTSSMSDYRKQTDGKHMAFNMTAVNHKNGRKSEIIIDEYKRGTDAAENYFSTSNLEK
ncbi:MAG: outer membrane lipoprotein-sorting protein [Bacteroidales bacterium]|nr:outer membrane lipoprotein-sorting protein [Bacteroidales bacterium]MDY0142470.1 outer membrane lipoprotein-sorting protein [Bacteroidales bacterium]